ncbi:MAG: NAD(P)-binding protein [Bacteroidetes bacterium]|nr:NAD(P)-binding protein [Bacteroidota bacterium]
MSIKIDYLIVGSGLTGGTIARMLQDSGREVLVLERRNHIGGNVHDHFHPSGIRVHTYGPHYFRTNSDRLWEFVNRFSSFYKYEASLKSFVDGNFENWPIAGSYIKKEIGENWKPSFEGNPENFEEASLKIMPELIYKKFVKGYTEKQWGIKASELSADLAKRFDVMEDDEPRLMRHKYQGIPANGYAEFTKNLIDGIPVILNFDFLQNQEMFDVRKKLIFTGPIDEYYNFELGKLEYRGQKRIHSYFEDKDFYQPCGQVNYPSPEQGNFIRILEWKHILPTEYSKRIKGTVITKEIPFSPQNPNDYEYPFPSSRNQTLFKKYVQRAQADDKLIICGRLGEYKYYDMDQAIARAISIANKIIEGVYDPEKYYNLSLSS